MLVFEQNLLPGVAYIEMARAAGTLASPTQPVRLIKQMIWSQPIIVDDSLTTTISLYPNNTHPGVIDFEVRTSQDEHNENIQVIHSQGQLVNDTSVQLPTAIDITNIASRCQCALDKKTLYQNLAEQGLAHGPSFQCLTWVKYTDDEALGLLDLPKAALTSSASNRDAFCLTP